MKLTENEKIMRAILNRILVEEVHAVSEALFDEVWAEYLSRYRISKPKLSEGQLTILGCVIGSILAAGITILLYSVIRL